jgi:hypothetical protein
MKIKMILLPISIILFLILIFALWQYVFTIYEVSIETSPAFLIADGKSTVMIKAIPLNALGFKAPFRKSPLNFEIKEGRELVSIIKTNDQGGEIVIQAHTKEGKISVLIKPKFSLEPSIVEVPIKEIE